MATINSFIIKLENLKNIDVNNALNKACILVQDEAKKKVPVDTGQLRNSITYEINGTSGYVGTNVEYAPYVEYGTGIFSSTGDGRTDVPWRYQDDAGNWHTTSGQKPQPYLLPALNENRSAILEIFKSNIKEELK